MLSLLRLYALNKVQASCQAIFLQKSKHSDLQNEKKVCAHQDSEAERLQAQQQKAAQGSSRLEAVNVRVFSLFQRTLEPTHRV